LLAICRGFEELNVAFGGTLHQHLEELPGRMDHRADRKLPRDEQYAPRHPVSLAAGGMLARLAGTGQVAVNSLHGQGIDRLGKGLVVEATAPDGTIEAVRVSAARNFALGVQWHAEWKVKEVPLSAAIFAAFGDAVRQRAGLREHVKA
jgi:putative glutamine amidotransferase